MSTAARPSRCETQRRRCVCPLLCLAVLPGRHTTLVPACSSVTVVSGRLCVVRLVGNIRTGLSLRTVVGCCQGPKDHPRGSSIADCTGCEVTKGMERWGKATYAKLVLKRADLLGVSRHDIAGIWVAFFSRDRLAGRHVVVLLRA